MWLRAVAWPLYFFNDLLLEVEEAELGVQLNNGEVCFLRMIL